MDTEQLAFPVLVAMTGFGVGGALPTMAAALLTGDVGGFFDALWNVFWVLVKLGVQSLGFWAAMAFATKVFDIWAQLLELAIAGAFVIIALAKLKAAGC